MAWYPFAAFRPVGCEAFPQHDRGLAVLNDLIDFGGSFISLGSIRAIHDETDFNEKTGEMERTGTVLIDFGAILPLAFEGDAASVMQVIDKWCLDKAWAGAVAPAPESARGGW